MTDPKFLEVAKKCALEAGRIIQKYSGKSVKRSIKEEDVSNFSTEADIESEKTIVEIIRKNFPTHNIIAEEKNRINNNSEYTWVIDPLDGTFAFSHSIPQYCVSIGLMKNNTPYLGVIYHLSSGELLWAQTGKGAFLGQKRVTISKVKNFEEAGLYFCFGHNERRKGKLKLYMPLFNKISRVFALGSTALSLIWVAEGNLDASVAQAWIWDFVAGTVIVREAGGKVTDFDGNEPGWTKERMNVVASNGLIHDQILEALK